MRTHGDASVFVCESFRSSRALPDAVQDGTPTDANERAPSWIEACSAPAPCRYPWPGDAYPNGKYTGGLYSEALQQGGSLGLGGSLQNEDAACGPPFTKPSPQRLTIQSKHSQRTVNVQSTYSQHTVNTQSTYSQHDQFLVVFLCKT